MSTDWTLCFICQDKKKEDVRPSIEGWKTLASILPQFFSYDAVGFCFTRLQCNVGLIENV